MEKEKAITGILKLLIGIGGFLFGGYDVGMKTVVALIIIDYITGWMAAFHCKTLSSKVGWVGLLKKIAILCVFAIANLLENLSGNLVPLRDIAVWFFVGNEGLSILENVSIMGLPIPDKIKDALIQVKNKACVTEDKEEKQNEQEQ